MTTPSKNTDVDSVEGLLGRLEQLNDIGAALSNERDITRLLEYILLAAKAITHADGGTLYRMAAQCQQSAVRDFAHRFAEHCDGRHFGQAHPFSRFATAQ